MTTNINADTAIVYQELTRIKDNFKNLTDFVKEYELEGWSYEQTSKLANYVEDVQVLAQKTADEASNLFEALDNLRAKIRKNEEYPDPKEYEQEKLWKDYE